MGVLGDLVVQIRGDTTQFVASLAKSQRSMTQFQRNMLTISRAVGKIGRAMTMGLTLPIVGIAAAAVKTAADFETSMNRVRAVSGATGKDFDALSETARELGKTTQFSAAEAADAMSFLAMAGFEANKIIGAMPGTLALAAAAQLDMGQSADIVSNIMSAFQLDAEELEGAVDVLTKTFTSSNTDLVQLGDAMKYVAPVANSLGVSIEEASAAIGILSNAGIQGQMAGTGLRKILTTLIQKSDALGISIYDSAGKILPFADIIDNLGAAGLSTSKIMQTFGERAGPSIQVLLAAGGGALREFTTELENAGGTAQRIADIQMEGFNGVMKRFKSVAQEAAIVIGTQLLPHVTAIIEKVQGWLTAFSELNANTRTTILRIAGLLAAAGPLLLVLSKIPAAVIAIKKALVVLSGPVGAIGLAITAAAILTTVIVRLIKRKREYERQVYATADAIRAETRAEQEARREALVKLWTAQAEEVNATRAAVAKLTETSEAAAAVDGSWNIEQESQKQLLIEREQALADIAAQLEVVEGVLRDETQAERVAQAAFDEGTASVEDYMAMLGELDDELDNVGDGLDDLAEKVQRLNNISGKVSLGFDPKAAYETTRLLELASNLIVTAADDYEEADERMAAVDAMRFARQQELLDAYAAGLIEQAALEEDYLSNSAANIVAYFDSLKARAAGAATEETHVFKENLAQQWIDRSEYYGVMNEMENERLAEIAAQAAIELQIKRDMYSNLISIVDDLGTAIARWTTQGMEDDEEAALQKLKILRAVAVAVKALKLAETIISGVRAISAAAETLDPVLIAAAIAGAAANVAAIIATPIPQVSLSGASGGGGGGEMPTFPAVSSPPPAWMEPRWLGDLDTDSIDKPLGGRRSGGDALQPVTVQVDLDSAPILKAVGTASRDGRVLISARAVV